MVRRSLRLTGIGLVIASVLAAVIWRMTWMAPAWYAPAPADDPAAVALAELVEQRLAEEIHMIRDVQPWTLRIREEQANAWLALRLRSWLAREPDLAWPEGLGSPQVRLESSGIRIAVPLRQGSRQRHLSMRIAPLHDDDELRLRIDRIWLGRIVVPGGGRWSAEETRLRLQRYAPDEAFENPWLADLVALLRGEAAIEPAIELSDGRRVRIIAHRRARGMIELTAVTRPPATSDPAAH